MTLITFSIVFLMHTPKNSSNVYRLPNAMIQFDKRTFLFQPGHFKIAQFIQQCVSLTMAKFCSHLLMVKM